VRIADAVPAEKPIYFFDGGGLYIHVTPAGGKLWRFRYRFEGKEKLLAFGKYPEISLADARQRRDEAKAMLAKGLIPARLQRNKSPLQRKRAKKNAGKPSKRNGTNATRRLTMPLARLPQPGFCWTTQAH
jgi:hypothetical protein